MRAAFRDMSETFALFQGGLDDAEGSRSDPSPVGLKPPIPHPRTLTERGEAQVVGGFAFAKQLGV